MATHSKAALALDKPKPAILHMRCYASDKLRWQKAARADSLKLTSWVVQTLNKAARKRASMPQDEGGGGGGGGSTIEVKDLLALLLKRR